MSGQKPVEMVLSKDFVPEGTKYCWFLAGSEGRLYKVSRVRNDGTTEWVRAPALMTLRYAGAWDKLLRRYV
jgi:hypothetical protein